MGREINLYNMDQDKKQTQNVTGVAPPPPANTNTVVADDDLDLTVSIKGDDGSLQNVDLDNIPAPDIEILKEKGEKKGNKEEKKELDVETFRKESKDIVEGDVAGDSVLKDLKDRAKKEEINTVNDELSFDLSELKPLKKVELKKEEKEDKENRKEKVDKDLEEIVTVDSLRELKPENVLDKKANSDHAAILTDEKVIDLDVELGDGLLDTENIKEENLKQTPDGNKEEDKEDDKEDSNKLKKVDLVNRVSKKAKSRLAPVQTLMRTETIHDRKQKGKKNVFSKNQPVGDSSGQVLDAVEELRVMSFDGWYRLGDIAEERIMKIKEKIEVLGEKGVIQQIKGLNAWRASNIMQEYLTAGIKALIKEKSIEDYFEDQAEKDSLKITLEEWYAVNKLNSQLMI
jgi:hypothetical protein